MTRNTFGRIYNSHGVRLHSGADQATTSIRTERQPDTPLLAGRAEQAFFVSRSDQR